jgi:hypothetical protein
MSVTREMLRRLSTDSPAKKRELALEQLFARAETPRGRGSRSARVRRAWSETTSNSTGRVPWPLAVPTAKVSQATRGTDW